MLTCLVFFGTAAAQETAQERNDRERSENIDPRVVAEGELWFQRMHQALTQLNYTASFVTVTNHSVQTYRWMQSHTPAGNRVELIETLNGPLNQSIRLNNQVVYVRPMSRPYSTRANALVSPIPAALYQHFSKIDESYQAISLAGERVVDRNAVRLRLMSRERNRYFYSLWVDRETGMLLGVQTHTAEGGFVEQVMLTSFQPHSVPLQEALVIENEWQHVPPTQELEQAEPRSQWQFSNLPSGFELQRSQHIQVAMNGPPADHFLFSDGMVNFSVYISEGAERSTPMQYQGELSFITVEQADFTVTVVGRIPLQLSEQIANSVSRKP